MKEEAQQKVVLITGAGGGLGQALVEQFTQEGWRVVAGFHSAPAATTIPTVLHVRLDVSDRASIESAVAGTLKCFGRLDVLINNAGLTADDFCGTMSDEDWARVLDVNLRGAFLCSQAVVRTMMRQRDGQIINLSSFGGRVGARGQSNYAAAKAGLIGLTQSLAKDLGARNVRINAILPGVLPTKMTAGLGPEKLEAFAQANALGRINSLDEVARFIAFLAGTRNISGQLFQLDSRIAPWT